MTEAQSTQTRSLDLAQRIDELVTNAVLVVGSPPPEGRDLDVMARPEEHAQVAGWLSSSGFSSNGDEWVRFKDCSVDALDLLSPTAFGLTEEATEALFGESHPLPGFRQLVRPAAHHVLLMLARWTSEADGTVSPKRRANIAFAVDQDPDVWQKAALQATAWRATTSLDALRRAFDSEAGMSRADRAAGLAEAVYGPGRDRSRALVRAWLAVARRRRRSKGRLVSFSGLDGAGKSSQAEALASALERLGFDIEIEWTRLEWTTLWENRWLGVLGSPARAALKLAARLRDLRSRTTKPTEDSGGGAKPLEPSALRERSVVISQVWVTIVALAHAAAQRRETRAHLRRGKVVICDRYTLDTAVHLRFRYGVKRNFLLQTRLVDRLSPRPSAAYLLDVPAATAYARKAEQYSVGDLDEQARLYREEFDRLGVQRLDGERPREELCAKIGEEVWRTLRQG